MCRHTYREKRERETLILFTFPLGFYFDASPLAIPFLARVSFRPCGICYEFLNTSCLQFGREWQRRSILKGGTGKQQEVCLARALAGEDQRNTKEPQFFNSPVRQFIYCLEIRNKLCKFHLWVSQSLATEIWQFSTPI